MPTTRLTVVLRATRDGARLTRAVRALAPLPADVALWVAHEGDAAALQAALAAVAGAAQVQLHPVGGRSPAALDNFAMATSNGAWTLFWSDTLLAAPALLSRLLQAATDAEAAARGRVVATPALLFGTAQRRLAGEPSPLLHFVAEREAARAATWASGAEVPPDQVGADAWAASRAALQAYGPFDETMPAGLHVVDFARRAYAEGCALLACDALQARRLGELSIAEAVAHWRALGEGSAALLEKHGDPHRAVRLMQRLAPHRDMLANAAALAEQLDAVDRRLVGLRRPHPAHVQGLQPSLASLYGVSVLEGALRRPEVQALWPHADASAPAPAADAPAPTPRRTRHGPRASGPRQPRELPRA